MVFTSECTKCHNGSYSSGEIALSMTYKCGIYIWEHQVSQWQLQDWRCSILCHWCWCGLQVWHLPLRAPSAAIAAMAVEGWHSVSLSLVWLAGVAFTYDYCHNGRYWSRGVAFSVTIIGVVHRCGIYLWLLSQWQVLEWRGGIPCHYHWCGL